MPKSIKSETPAALKAATGKIPAEKKKKKTSVATTAGVTKPVVTEAQKKKKKEKKDSNTGPNAKEWTKLAPKQKDELHVLLTQKHDIGYLLQTLKEMEKVNLRKIEAKKPRRMMAAVAAPSKASTALVGTF